MTDTQTDLLAALKGEHEMTGKAQGILDEALKADGEADYQEVLGELHELFDCDAGRVATSRARAAIERAEKGTPDLDLNDQVEAKRVNECPDCETETDTTRNNGANGDEYVEYCMNDDCEWETKLGTVTESLS